MLQDHHSTSLEVSRSFGGREHQVWGRGVVLVVSQIQGTIFGGPYNILFWGSTLGSPYLWKLTDLLPHRLDGVDVLVVRARDIVSPQRLGRAAAKPKQQQPQLERRRPDTQSHAPKRPS